MHRLFNWLKEKHQNSRSPAERSQHALDVLAWQSLEEDMAFQDQLRQERAAAEAAKVKPAEQPAAVVVNEAPVVAAGKPVKPLKAVRFKPRRPNARA